MVSFEQKSFLLSIPFYHLHWPNWEPLNCNKKNPNFANNFQLQLYTVPKFKTMGKVPRKRSPITGVTRKKSTSKSIMSLLYCSEHAPNAAGNKNSL
jgi:hypothetical protein